MCVASWMGRLFGKTRSARLFLGSVLLLMLIVTRWAWIDCDSGVPSLNEYGYFATDEGYYCGGGRMKFLRGMFISARRAAPCTYKICPSTHVMTWWSFSLFGQTTWAHRVFPLAFCTGAWLAVFAFLARRTLPWIAFLLCAVCTLNPLLIVYGRTACNDTLMASLLLLGYVLTRRRGRLPAFLGGCVFGLGLWIKMSIWALFPLGLSATAMSSSRLRLKRAGLFLAGFALSACVQYGLIRLLIAEDATEQGVSIANLLAVSDSSYPLPNLFDWRAVLRAVSSFPRCPADGLLGIWSALFLALPCLLVIHRLTERPIRWDGRLLLYLTLPLYAGGIMLLPVFYSHYFIPAITFTPLVWYEARHDLKRWSAGRTTVGWAHAAAGWLIVVLAYHTYTVSKENATLFEPYLSNAYNLPTRIVWSINGGYVLGLALLLALLVMCTRPRRPSPLFATGVLLSALGIADLCFSSIPLCEAHKYTPLFSPNIRSVAHVLQLGVIAVFFVVWGIPNAIRHSTRWYWLFAVLLIGGTFANPVWRTGSVELIQRSHLQKKAAAELARLLPDNAVVFGERAPQLLLSLRPRASSAPNADPVPILFKVHEAHPEWPLYALLDSEHNYHYTHYMAHQDRIQMEVLHTLKLPSFNTCLPVDVFLVRLHILDGKGNKAAQRHASR